MTPPVYNSRLPSHSPGQLRDFLFFFFSSFSSSQKSDEQVVAAPLGKRTDMLAVLLPYRPSRRFCRRLRGRKFAWPKRESPNKTRVPCIQHLPCQLTAASCDYRNVTLTSFAASKNKSRADDGSRLPVENDCLCAPGVNGTGFLSQRGITVKMK